MGTKRIIINLSCEILENETKDRPGSSNLKNGGNE